MRALIRESRHISGDYMEIDMFPVRKTSSSRKAKAKPSTEAQKALNARNAARRLTWLIQDNFGTSDFYCSLTYPSDFDTRKMNGKMFDNWLRRIKRKYKKADIDFRYIATSEQGERNHRLHHHIICSGELGADVLRAEWNKQFSPCKKGYAHTDHLIFTRTGLACLAFYTVKDPMLAYRSYTCSKNLVHRPPQTRDGRISGKKLKELRKDNFNKEEFERLYPGYEFVDADPHLEIYDINEYGEANEIDFPYLTVRMFRKDSKYILRGIERL